MPVVTPMACAAAKIGHLHHRPDHSHHIADVLPNEIAPYISSQMDLGAAAMQKALGKS